MPTYADINTPAAVIPAAQDFWRTPAANGALPDGVTDVTDTITHNGIVGIGSNFATVAPVSLLDVGVTRSGVDGRVAGVTPLYVTGPLPGIGGGVAPAPTPVGGAEIRHSNQSQGFGFAFDGIYATGSVADQNFNLVNRGTGQYFIHHQALNGGNNYINYNSVPLADQSAQGWQQRWWAGIQQAGLIIRKSNRLALPGAGTLATEWFFQGVNELGTFRNKLYLGPSRCGSNLSRMEVGENDVNDDKLVLFGIDSTNFFGIGIKGATIAYFCAAPATNHHRWYAGACPGTQLMGLSSVGNLTLDPNGTAAAGWLSPVLRFGGEASNEGIRSQRTVVDRFQNDIEFYTGSVRRGAFLANGRFYLNAVPVFASDGAAGAGGLLTGEVFRDALGILHIKL